MPFSIAAAIGGALGITDVTAATLVGGALLGGGIGAGTSALEGGSLSQDLKGGAAGALGGLLVPAGAGIGGDLLGSTLGSTASGAIGGALGGAAGGGLGSLITGGNAGESALIGGLSGGLLGGESGYAGNLPGDVFSGTSGLSSFLGGTEEPEANLATSYNGFNSDVPGGADLTASAQSAPQAAAAQSVGAVGVPAAGGGGGLGGGAATGLGAGGQVGENLGNTGSAISGELPNSTPPTDFAQAPTAGTQNFLNNLPSAGPSPTDALNPAVIQASNAATPGGTDLGLNQQSGLSKLFGGTSPIAQSGGSVAASTMGGAMPTDALNPAVIQASNAATPGGIDTSLNQQGGLANLFGSTSPIAQSGGNMTASIASPLNGLINGGLSYLLGNNNQHGANVISGAAAQANSNLAPYMATGTAAENTLGNLYGTNGTAAQTTAMNNFQQTPGYQFALGQGLNAVNANAAAMGNPLSGNNEEAINNYAQGTASQQYNNYVNQLSSLASGGAAAAGATGSNLLTGAGAQSQVGQNQANLQNNAIGTGLNALFPTGGINLAQILQGGGGGGGAGILGVLGLNGGGSY